MLAIAMNSYRQVRVRLLTQKSNIDNWLIYILIFSKIELERKQPLLAD